MVNGLQLPPHIMRTAAHKLPACDADSATLKAIVERGKLPGATQSFASRSCALGLGDEVELLVKMPTEIKGELDPGTMD